MKLAQILVSVLGISLGQLILKVAALKMHDPNVPSISIAGYGINGYFIAGVSVLGLATLVWVWVLRSVPLGIAYPFMALCFIIVPALGFFVLGEPVTWKTFVGSALIVGGVAIIST